MELQRWLGVGERKHTQSALLSMVRSGRGAYDGGLRYEIHVRKCGAMCRVSPRSGKGEGSLKLSRLFCKDFKCPLPSWALWKEDILRTDHITS